MYTQGSVEFNQIIETPNNKAIKSRLVLLDDNTIIDKIKSLILYSASCSQELQIGTTNMAYIDAEVECDLILTNREVRLECGVGLSDGTVEYIPMGVFTIQKPQGDIDFVKFTANDRMQKFDYPYSSALTYPTTDKAMLEELATMCGVTLATNIDNPITIDKALDGYTRREVLGYIAGLHGKFACFNRNGELELKWYNADNPITKNIGLIWGFEKSDEDFTVSKIEVAKNNETTLTSGNGYGVVQHSNPLATQEIVNDLFTILNGFTYNASVVDILDDIRLDLGDVIKVTYLDGKDYLVPCMSIKQDFAQGSTNIESFAKSDTENTYRFTGPTIQYLNRMAMELLVANRVIATKVDAEYVNSHAITTENFDAKVAEITELIVDEIDGKYANIDLANIDIANINVGKIGELFAKVGLIDRATIVEGHITGFLDAVEVNANKITAGTLIADRILLSGGEKGVLYALNNLGELTSTNVDTLDGYVLTDRTITADKIIAKSITTNELDVNQIFGNEAVLNKLVAQDAFINAIETNRIIVGASENASKALEEVNKTVKSITMHYLATTLGSGVTTSSSGWTTTVQQIDATKKYLWTYQTITYVDNTTTDTSPVISGVYGNEGKDGEDGEDGTNGVGITSVIPLYYLNSTTSAPSAPASAVTSTSTASGVWTKSVPTYVANYTYFTCTQTQYTNGTYGWSTVVADNALTNANKTANTANTNASNAVSTANTASANASNAVSTANTANSTANTANNTANAIKTNIYKSGTTLIDGAKIYTGSITADKINVNDLFAQDITATGTITGAHLISNGTTTTTIFGSGHNYTLSPINWGWSDSGTLVTGIEKAEFGAGYFTLNELIKFSGKGFDYQDTNILSFNTDGIYSPKINAENLAVKEKISSTELITTDITVGSGGVYSNGDVTVLGNIKTVSVLGSSADLTVDGITTLNGNTTVKGQLVTEQGMYVNDIGAVGWGSEGYIVLARMEITSPWMSSADIEFDIIGINQSGKVLFRFNNPSVATDTRVELFTQDSLLSQMYYALTVGTDRVTIDLIGQKPMWGGYRIINIRATSHVFCRAIITFPNTFESILRNGAVAATMSTKYVGGVCAFNDLIARFGTDQQASLSTLWDMVKLFPPYELTDINNPKQGIGLGILGSPGGDSTLYLSFTFSWITIQFAADSNNIYARKYYGNNGWSDWVFIR